jgi:thiamine-phosphate pyrophosphorylase
VRIDFPRIYPITDRRISGLSHCEQVRRLIEGGATVIQLREKEANARDFYADASDALRLAHSAGARLIINDRVDIALILEADGVHLGQSDLPVEAARRLLGKDAVIGFSTHNTAQVKDALKLPIDYLAFGPIYETATKANPDPVAGLPDLSRIRSLLGSFPLVAIGGINQLNLRPVLAAGADAVAVISAVLADPAKIGQNLIDLRASADFAMP